MKPDFCAFIQGKSIQGALKWTIWNFQKIDMHSITLPYEMMKQAATNLCKSCTQKIPTHLVKHPLVVVTLKESEECWLLITPSSHLYRELLLQREWQGMNVALFASHKCMQTSRWIQWTTGTKQWETNIFECIVLF